MAGRPLEAAKEAAAGVVRTLRPEDHQEDLWRGLVKDDLQCVGTDHCPFDFVGMKDLGKDDFRKIPNGLPGVEERMDLMFQGVVNGRYPKERWVEITSTAASRIFGLAGKKGGISASVSADHRESAGHVEHSSYRGNDVTALVSAALTKSVSMKSETRKTVARLRMTLAT